MSGRRQVRLSGELAARVEAVAESIRPRPAFSATAEMLVEDGLRAREANSARDEDLRWYVDRLELAIGEAEREAELYSSDKVKNYCKGQAAGLRQALRLLKGGA